jgi:hypothetical protein
MFHFVKKSGYTIAACAFLISSGIPSFPQTPKPMVDATPIPPDRGAAATWQALKKLHTRASLLMKAGEKVQELRS